MKKRQKIQTLGCCSSRTERKGRRDTERKSRNHLWQPQSKQKRDRSAHVSRQNVLCTWRFQNQSVDQLDAGHFQPMQRSACEAETSMETRKQNLDQCTLDTSSQCNVPSVKHRPHFTARRQIHRKRVTLFISEPPDVPAACLEDIGWRFVRTTVSAFRLT